MEEYLNVQYLGSSNALLITAQGIFLKAFIQTGLGVNSLWHRQTTASQILTRDICSSGVQNENTNPSELILVQPGNSNIHGKAGPILFKEFFSVVSTSCLSPGIFSAWLKDSHPIKRQDLFLWEKSPHTRAQWEGLHFSDAHPSTTRWRKEFTHLKLCVSASSSLLWVKEPESFGPTFLQKHDYNFQGLLIPLKQLDWSASHVIAFLFQYQGLTINLWVHWIHRGTK